MTVRRTVRTRDVARGKRRANNIITAVVFDPPTFAEIRSAAVRRRISVAERIRDLVELGIETERLG